MTTMTTTEEDLMQLEGQFWDAIQARDGATVARLTARDCTIVGASGVTAVDPRSIVPMIEGAPFSITEYRIDPSSVRVTPIGEDAVTVAYAVREDVVIDGKPLQLDAFDTSVWRHEREGWTCVLHTESIAGDPFGRDRQRPS
jgi:ketosteroid isomerase-like protein